MDVTATYKGAAITSPTYANGEFTFSALDAHGGELIISVVPKGTKGATAGSRSSEAAT